jgi:hypothetical protein
MFAALFFVALAVYLLASVKLMNGPDFNDETEKLVTAMLIFEGRRLYSDIFVQHGPVAYMLSHLMYVVFPVQDIAVQRVIPILLTLVTLVAVMVSPLLKGREARFFAGSVMLLGIAAVQPIFGLVMAMYQGYAGLFFGAAMAIFVAPLALGYRVGSSHAIAGGAFLALVFLCAFSFAPAIAACVLIGIWGLISSRDDRRRILRAMLQALIGASAATTVVAVWMVLFADFGGYFVDHIYFNLTAYKAYLLDANPIGALKLLVPGWTYWLVASSGADGIGTLSAAQSWFAHLIYAIPPVILLGWVAFLWRSKRYRAASGRIFPSLLLLIAVVWTNPRLSVTFGASTFTVVVIVSLAIVLGMVWGLGDKSGRKWMSLACFGLLLFTGLLAQSTTRTFLYGVTPRGYYKMHGALRPEQSPSMKRLRDALDGDLHALQVPFNLTFYTRAGVVPSSGIFYWMPWMNDYSKNPVKGYELDLCGEMNRAPPKAISYLERDATIWGHSPDTYLSCFKDLLARKYVAIPSIPSVWLRADVLAKQEDLLTTAVISPALDLSWLGEREQSAFLDIRRSSRALAPSPTCAAPIRNPASAPADVGSCDSTLVLRKSLIMSSETGQCLEITGASTRAGAPARYWPCTGSSNQLFDTLPVDGGFRIRNKFSGLCLSATADKLTQQVCDSSTVWPLSPGETI